MLLKDIPLVAEHHEESWKKFEELCSKYFKFNMFMLSPITHTGAKLLHDGYFLTFWLKVISLNPFINKDLIIKQAYQDYSGSIESDREEFEEFYRSHIKAAEELANATPIKKNQETDTVEGSKLKRSILKKTKSSSKKVVKFDEDSRRRFEDTFFPHDFPNQSWGNDVH